VFKLYSEFHFIIHREMNSDMAFYSAGLTWGKT